MAVKKTEAAESKAAETAKKTPAKKTTAAKKTTPAKKSTTAKKPSTSKKAPAEETAEEETAIELILQFQGRDIDLADILDKVLDATDDKDLKKSPEKISIYVQPENGVAYYTIDDVGDENSKVEI